MRRTFISSFRFLLVITLVVLGFGGLLGRLFYLHVIDQERLAEITQRSRSKFEQINADRGDIVDVRGNVLATTRAVVEVGVDPQMFCEEDVSKLENLAQLIRVPLPTIQEKIATKYYKSKDPKGKEVSLVRWRELADNVSGSVYEKIKALKIKGVYGNVKYERLYPSGALASHVLGFVNKEDDAVMGVEQTMDFYLRGQHGWRESEKDGRRKELAQFRGREVNPTPGLNIELSLDSMVQDIIEKEIRALVEKYNPKGISVLVSEPTTGYILGLANYPSFNPNNFWKYPVDWHRNRAVTDVYEPGSTFKVVPISGVLNEKLVTLDDEIDCSQSRVEYEGRWVSLPKDHKRFEILSVHDVISRSSNRGVAHLGMILGKNGLYDYAKAFGFGERTGLGIPGEAAGMLHKVSRWDGLTISRMPMGHAISATPLQAHYATSVIANEGILMYPQLVKRVFDQDGDTLVDFHPRAKRRVLDAEVAETVAGLLDDTSSSRGTGKRAEIQGFAVAGKSGTSQKIINGKYSQHHHVASFSGFFPADEPRVVITVVVDEPQLKGTGWGGLVAAPSFKNIAKELIQYLGIQSEQNRIVAWQNNSLGSSWDNLFIQ